MNRFSPPMIYAFLWLAALAGSFMLFHGYESCSVAFSLSVLGTGLMFMILKHPFAHNIPRASFVVMAMLGAFWLVALASAALSEVRFVSFIFFGFFSVLPLSFFWGMLLWEKQEAREFFIGGLALFGFLLSFSTLAQYLAMPELLFYGRTEWPLANPNSLAALLSFFCFLGLGGTLGAQGAYKKIFAALALISFLAIVTTASRGAMLSLILAGGVGLLFLRKGLPGGRKFLLFLPAAALAGVACLAFLAPDQAEELSLAQRAAATLSGKMPALWDSPALWRSTWSMIQDHIWTGTGIGTFYLYYPQYRGNDFYTAGLMAHNDPLQFWAEMGFLAPVLFYALGLTALVLTIRAAQKTPAGDPRRAALIMPACALAAMMLHAHITFNFYVFPCLMMAGMTLSFWLHSLIACPAEKFYAPPSEKTRNIIKGAALAALSAFLFAFLMMQSSLILTEQAQRSAQAGNLEGFDRKLAQAEKLSGGRNPGTYLLAATLGLNILELPDSGLSEADKKNLTAQGLNLLRRAEDLNPRQPDIFYREAGYHKAAGHAAESERALMKALSIDPSHLSARQMLADLYLIAGDKHKSLRVLKEGIPYSDIHTEKEAYLKQTAILALELGDFETNRLVMHRLGGKIGADMGYLRSGYRIPAVRPSK